MNRALLMSFADRYANMAIGIASTMVLSRLLTPADIGAFSVAVLFCGFAAVFRDFGSSQYLIRHANPSAPDKQRTLAVLVLLGVLLTAVISIAAFPLAQFYKDQRIATICLILACNFLVNAFLAYPMAWLTRQMQFGHLALSRLSGSVLGSGLTIALVVLGHGPVSLAWGTLGTTAAILAHILAFSQPKLPWKPRFDRLKPILSFGGFLTLSNVLTTARNALPELLVGRILGLSQASFLSRGQSLCTMFDTVVTSAIWPIILPYLSRAHAEQRELGPIIGRALALLCGIGWPVFAVLAIVSQPAILVLFGPQWDQAVVPARWLALMAATMLPFTVLFAALIAVNAVRSLLWVNFLLTIAVLAGVALGSSQDLGMTVASMALVLLAAAVPALEMARRSLGMSAAELLKPLLVALGMALLVAAAPFALLVQVTVSGYAAAMGLLAACAITAAVVQLSLLAWFKHPLWEDFGQRIIDGAFKQFSLAKHRAGPHGGASSAAGSRDSENGKN